jgi:hypothetical protein
MQMQLTWCVKERQVGHLLHLPQLQLVPKHVCPPHQRRVQHLVHTQLLATCLLLLLLLLSIAAASGHVTSCSSSGGFWSLRCMPMLPPDDCWCRSARR